MFRWFENRIDAFPKKQPQVPPRGIVAFCSHHCAGLWPWFILMAIATAAVAGIEVAMFGVLGDMVDWLNTSQKEGFFAREWPLLAGLSFLVLLALPFANTISILLLHQTITTNFPMRIRWNLHRYLLGQSMQYFESDFAGRISTKLMQTSMAVRETLIKLFEITNYVLVYAIGTLILVTAADWRFIIPFAAWIVSYGAILYYFVPRLRKSAESLADARSSMTGRIVDAYANINTVKLFSYNGGEENFAREGLESFQSHSYHQLRLASWVSICIYTSNCLLIFAVGALGVILWQNSLIAVGSIAITLGLALRLKSMAQWVIWEISALFENIGTVADGIQSFTKERAIEDKPHAPALTVKKGAIRFEDVGFHYGKGTGVIEHFNLEIKPGEKVGIIGRSGAGKSTLVNLLLRFYDVEKGRILIDGQNIADVTQESLRHVIGMVTQDTSLLHRSIRDNILYGRPNATEEELVRAVKNAQADGFIPSLQDHYGRRGFDAYVGERGARLSGGQRQRIAISRVILKNAPILILDEATSALDSEAESVIQQNLDQLMEGKTVLAIAHRLSTIAAMDRLIVMDKGAIAEMGTHEELLTKGGLYAKLWQKQVGKTFPFKKSA